MTTRIYKYASLKTKHALKCILRLKLVNFSFVSFTDIIPNDALDTLEKNPNQVYILSSHVALLGNTSNYIDRIEYALY